MTTHHPITPWSRHPIATTMATAISGGVPPFTSNKLFDGFTPQKLGGLSPLPIFQSSTLPSFHPSILPLPAPSARSLGEFCSIGVDNDGENDDAAGDHLPHKATDTHKD